MRRLTRESAGTIPAGVACLLASAAALAQGPPAMGPGPGRPDLTGYWTSGGVSSIFSQNPPLTPEAAAIRARNRQGLTSPTEQGLDELDPATWCYPIGPARAMVLRQFQIVQTPPKTYILTEWDSLVRHVYTDGREHPPGWPFGWMGHSIGRYEDDTLIVDTVSLNGIPWLDFSGTPYSDALHMVERIRRAAQDRLEIQFRFEDPQSYSRPWESTITYSPAQENLDHVTCEDYLQMGTYREAYWPPR